MLTRRSSVMAKSRQLIVVPLLLVCTLCFTKTGYAQRFERRGDGVFTKGYTFVMSPDKVDSMTYIEPESGREVLQVVTMTPMPVKFNGEDIPVETTDKFASFGDPPKSFRSYLLTNMVSELSKLDDGTYTLNVGDILVDKDGKVLYFHYEDLKPGKPGAMIAPAFQQELFSKVCALTESAPAFIPGTVGGLPVVSYYEEKDNEFWTKFKVVNHYVFDENANKEYILIGPQSAIKLPAARLGNIPTAPVPAGQSAGNTLTTYDQILKDPTVMTVDPKCDVLGFTISFLPKGQDYGGPYKTKGSQIGKEQIAFLKELKAAKNEKTMIFIEDIHVMLNGKEEVLPHALLLTCKPKL